MHWFSWLRRHRDYVALIVCFSLSCFLLGTPEALRFEFARLLGGVVLMPAKGVLRLGEHLSHLRGENEVLAEQLMELSDRLVRSEELEKEAQRLRRLLNFRETESYRFLPAQLLSYPISFRERNLLHIDRGLEDGVSRGQPVVNPAGLIGKVFSVDVHEARVLLLMSKNFAVSCRDRRSRVLGVCKWDPRRGFYVDRVDPTEDVRVGDHFMTSGLGVHFPEGFLLGRVVAVRDSPGVLRKEILLEPAVPMQTLEDVFVVTEVSEAASGFPLPLEDPASVPADSLEERP